MWCGMNSYGIWNFSFILWACHLSDSIKTLTSIVWRFGCVFRDILQLLDMQMNICSRGFGFQLFLWMKSSRNHWIIYDSLFKVVYMLWILFIYCLLIIYDICIHTIEIESRNKRERDIHERYQGCGWSIETKLSVRNVWAPESELCEQEIIVSKRFKIQMCNQCLINISNSLSYCMPSFGKQTRFRDEKFLLYSELYVFAEN